MPHQHHQGCEDENHDHDHEHDSSELGFQDNLFTYIDRGNAIALNAGGNASDIIKPWHERFDETKVMYLMVEIIRYSLRPSRVVSGVRRRRSDVHYLLCFSWLSRFLTWARFRIIRIPFTGSVRLRSLLLKSGPGDQTPSKIALVNKRHLSELGLPSLTKNTSLLMTRLWISRT